MLRSGIRTCTTSTSSTHKQELFAYYKLGDGPFYLLYTPYHLPHVQIPATIARAVLHHDPTVAVLDGPSCEVVTVAKRDLKTGETLDGVGGFLAYGLIDNRSAARATNALPIAMSDGCVLTRDVPRDAVVSFDDVVRPERTIVDDLWDEQLVRWPVARADHAPDVATV